MTTDIIVGFPGETEEDFERTLEVASQAAYDSAYTFIFSPRPGTRAALMTELFVPGDEVADRFERLKVVIERSALARNRARVGRVEEAIVEGPSRKDPDVLSGRTRQGKLVHFAARTGERLDPGTFVTRADRPRGTASPRRDPRLGASCRATPSFRGADTGGRG